MDDIIAFEIHVSHDVPFRCVMCLFVANHIGLHIVHNVSLFRVFRSSLLFFVGGGALQAVIDRAPKAGIGQAAGHDTLKSGGIEPSQGGV